MFVSVVLAAGMFTMNVRTKLYKPGSNSSLVIVIKPKPKYTIYAATILSFYILQKYAKVVYFLGDFLSYKISGPQSVASVKPDIQSSCDGHVVITDSRK
jgi:hypothetical protein